MNNKYIEPIIPKSSRTQIYMRAWKKWGSELQLIMIIEEAGELIKSVTKFLRVKQVNNVLHPELFKIAHEIADVEIMCEQVKTMYALDVEVARVKKEKLLRLKSMVEES